MLPTLRLLQKARWRRRIRVMLWWTGSLWCETRSVLKWSYFYKKYDTNHFRPFSCVIVFPILWWHLCLSLSKGTFDWPCSGTGIYSNDEEKSIDSHGRTKYTSTGIMCYKSYWLQLDYVFKTDILSCMSFSLFFSNVTTQISPNLSEIPRLFSRCWDFLQGWVEEIVTFIGIFVDEGFVSRCRSFL